MPPSEDLIHEQDDGMIKQEEATPNVKKEWTNDFEPLSIDDYLDQPDLVDNHGDASFTGVWDAAKEFATFVLSDSTSLDSVAASRPTIQRVLELGSGTGWLGITLARNNAFGGDNGTTTTKFVLSDNPHNGAMQWTQRNLEAAQTVRQLPNLDAVQVVPLDWNDTAQIRQVANMEKWDLIIGSDLIYSEDGCCALAQTMAMLLREQRQHSADTDGGDACCILYAHSQGRMPELDVLWAQQLQEQGLTNKILASKPQSWHKDRTVIISLIELSPHQNNIDDGEEEKKE